jgi:hypothetical protein
VAQSTEMDSEPRAGDRAERPLPLGRPPEAPGLAVRIWRSPLFRLALYYLVLVLIAATLIRHFPVVRRALITPVVPVLSEGAALLSGEGPPESWSGTPALLTGTLERAVTTLLVILGAIALAIPVAWIYMVTKRLRYDPGLVRSVVILPIAVAGILLVVKNSLAIAFSLAGIVAAVRFRNTLKDPRDAVFVFLTIAIGISAGVQALDVALVVSLVFNLAVLALWSFQVGSIYGGSYGRTGVLSIGDASMMVAQTPEARRGIRRQLIGHADDMKTDGILLVHSTDPEMARHSVQDALSQTTRDWRLLGLIPRGEEVATAQYLVRLARKHTPADLIGALDEWSVHVPAAEFIPLRLRRNPRPDRKGKKKREGAAG